MTGKLQTKYSVCNHSIINKEFMSRLDITLTLSMKNSGAITFR
uniref:Uncharacterized protein n=1 Tax=Arundo donax TaxID=35708 RepID=A0A0A9HEY5_ARUDO